jgi:hypothetical protein
MDGARLFEPCPNATIEFGAIDGGGRSAQVSPSEPDEMSLSSWSVLLWKITSTDRGASESEARRPRSVSAMGAAKPECARSAAGTACTLSREDRRQYASTGGRAQRMHSAHTNMHPMHTTCARACPNPHRKLRLFLEVISISNLN